MAVQSSNLAWEIPWTEEPGWATVHETGKESDMTYKLNNQHHNRASAYSLPSVIFVSTDTGLSVNII